MTVQVVSWVSDAAVRGISEKLESYVLNMKLRRRSLIRGNKSKELMQDKPHLAELAGHLVEGNRCSLQQRLDTCVGSRRASHAPALYR